MRHNTKKQTTKTENLAGGVSFKRNKKQELVFSVLTSFLEDKFYESSSNRMKRIEELVKEIAKKEPLFVAKLAYLTRKEFHMRSSYHWMVATLAKYHKGDSLVGRLIEASAERPDDLTEIYSASEKPIPNQIKKGIRFSFNNFDEYQLAKYRGSKRNVSLVDLMNLTHPKPNEENEEIFEKLINNKLKTTGKTWESKMSAGEEKKKVWNDLVKEGKVGYMALLRNLRNIEETGDNELIDKVSEIISNKEKVKKSKQLPFRFYTAFKNVSNNKLLEAIAKALQHSVDNVPDLNGKTLIAVDTSGSMSGKPIEIASLFASALFAKTENSDVILYDTGVVNFKGLKSDSIITNIEKILNKYKGGGTETSLVFKHAEKFGSNYDRIIILSDNESWSEGLWRSSVQRAYNKYRKVNDCMVYAIDIAGYGTSDVKGNKVFHFTSWSEKIFDFIDIIENKGDIVEYIENYPVSF